MKCSIKKTLLIFALCFLTFEFASACPFCKDAADPGFAKGIYWSILLMVGVPLVVVGSIFFAYWKAYRRSNLDRGRSR